MFIYYFLLKWIKKTLLTVVFIFLAIASIVAVVAYNLNFNTLPKTGDVTPTNSTVFDFDSCALAGYPIMESYPAQCRTPDGKVYVQEVSQIANPASEFCVENGGTVEIRKDLQGEAGFCIFENGNECEEWAYFNGECAP